MTDGLVIGGDPLTIAQVAAAARDPRVGVSFAEGVPERLRANSVLATRIAEEHSLYGRTTGVGANRDVVADDRDGQHGRRLLRSHTAGYGPVLPDEVGRALVIVRAHQLAAGRSGVAPPVAEALIDARRLGLVPVVRRHGGVGTGDITVLAELGLALLGERPWSDGTTRALLDDIDASGALPLMSSNAPTLALAALALHDVQALSTAMLVVAALSAHAVRANPEAWSVVGASSRPHPGMVHVGSVMRALLGDAGYQPGRLQDPFAWRCLVSVHGALSDVLDQVRVTLEIDINASCENPLYTDSGSWHHGGFNHTGLALGLDQLRLALAQAAGLGLSRLTHLNNPAMSGLRPFLSEGPNGSSGTMVLEYTAASSLADLRQWAAPATLGHAVISLGIEDHASFAWQSAIATRSSLVALRTVIACELVAALLSVRRHRDVRSGTVLAALLDRCASIPDEALDHALVDDLGAADALLDQLGDIVTTASAADTR